MDPNLGLVHFRCFSREKDPSNLEFHQSSQYCQYCEKWSALCYQHSFYSSKFLLYVNNCLIWVSFYLTKGLLGETSETKFILCFANIMQTVALKSYVKNGLVCVSSKLSCHVTLLTFANVWLLLSSSCLICVSFSLSKRKFRWNIKD